MNSRELVAKTIKGENPGRTPLYGWVLFNMEDKINSEFGSVKNFEDHYQFDMAHIFGGPSVWNRAEFDKLKSEKGELLPEDVLDIPLMPVDNIEDYKNIKDSLEFYQKQRNRFCYLQTNGIFECTNGAFGIEDHLCNMALYPDEMKEIYNRLAQWNKKFASNAIELGMDMIHISDDWGAQKSLMFSNKMLEEMILPAHKQVCDFVKSKGTFLSMHNDGCITSALDDIVELGYDVLHPWQESAGMSYDLYLNKYQDKLAILGGMCIQTTLGFGNLKKVEDEIKRVFSLLKHKRWMFCTTHFVQSHCSIEELVFAYDLARKLAD